VCAVLLHGSINPIADLHGHVKLLLYRFNRGFGLGLNGFVTPGLTGVFFAMTFLAGAFFGGHGGPSGSGGCERLLRRA
jgi:hypothetical protein